MGFESLTKYMVKIPISVGTAVEGHLLGNVKGSQASRVVHSLV